MYAYQNTKLHHFPEENCLSQQTLMKRVCKARQIIPQTYPNKCELWWPQTLFTLVVQLTCHAQTSLFPTKARGKGLV